LTSQATFICTYCGRHLPTAERSVEHPLGQSIGGSGWWTRDVCKQCNRERGRDVDRPFAEQPIVVGARHMFGVPDLHGNVPDAPRLFGAMENGGRGYLELGRNGARARRVPQVIQRDENVERYVVESGEGEELLRKREARLRQRHGEDIKIVSSVEAVHDETTANIPYSLKITVWPRFGAKLGLAFGRHVLGTDWLSTPQAAHLRDVLSGNDPEPADLAYLWDTIQADDVFSRLAPPPAHLIAVCANAKGAGLMVQIFGQMRYRVPLSLAARTDTGWLLWTFDPAKGKARQTTIAELADESIRRGDWRTAPDSPAPG
jgi:HNH endonuclease